MVMAIFTSAGANTLRKHFTWSTREDCVGMCLEESEIEWIKGNEAPRKSVWHWRIRKYCKNTDKNIACKKLHRQLRYWTLGDMGCKGKRRFPGHREIKYITTMKLWDNNICRAAGSWHQKWFRRKAGELQQPNEGGRIEALKRRVLMGIRWEEREYLLIIRTPEFPQNHELNTYPKKEVNHIRKTNQGNGAGKEMEAEQTGKIIVKTTTGTAIAEEKPSQPIIIEDNRWGARLDSMGKLRLHKSNKT